MLLRRQSWNWAGENLSTAILRNLLERQCLDHFATIGRISYLVPIGPQLSLLFTLINNF